MPCSICDNKVVESNGKCASCNFEERKAERMAKKAKKVYRIPKVSAKMKEDLKTYAEKRKEHLKKFPNCQIKLQGCTKVATEIHHSKKRGKNLNDEKYFMSACRPCHDKCERVLSAKERREKGLLI